jgi:flagellar assembly protein FliH
MTVKSWTPNAISSKPAKAFVGMDGRSINEPDTQADETSQALNWSPAVFPDISPEQNNSLDTNSVKADQVNDGCCGWQPAEMEAAFVINRDDNARFSHSRGKSSSQNQYFNEITKKSEAILTQTNSRATEIIAKAEKQANEIIQQAENQAMHLTHQAYQDGLAAANAEISDLLKTARAIAEEVEAWRDNTLSKGEMMMLRLVIEIAQSLFGEGLPLDPDTLGNAFSRALSQAKTLGDLRIYVHPEDAVALTPHWAQQQATFSGQKIELIPSDIIKRGGCFIEGQYGSVDARIETQLQMTKDTLLETLSMPVGSSV